MCPGALQALLGAAGAHPRAGILAPRLVSPGGATEHSVHPFPTLPLTLAFNLGLPMVSRRLADRLALEGAWNPSRPRAVDWAVGAFLLVRRRTWEELGGFDPGHWMYAEDLDLGWRAARLGWQTWFEPGAVVRHVGGASSSQAWGAARRERWLRSTYGWMLRRRGGAVTRTYALLNAAGALARLLALAPAGGGRRAAERAELRAWLSLHLAALVSSRQRLADQR
jgi:GT2 family glycosyltransferase